MLFQKPTYLEALKTTRGDFGVDGAAATLIRFAALAKAVRSLLDPEIDADAPTMVTMRAEPQPPTALLPTVEC